jgi:hypothetical protein
MLLPMMVSFMMPRLRVDDANQEERARGERANHEVRDFEELLHVGLPLDFLVQVELNYSASLAFSSLRLDWISLSR